ncbi:hypothetical protein AAGR08_20185 (plasmid) [Pantoea sp. BRR-3P]|uniref:hypothetical protein n=1 Tax=Pantoea sp. BRR-3P TaxID=3141541 RepID=UPI0031F5160C
MEKALKPLIVTAIFVSGLVAYFIPYIKMEFSGSAHYTEQNKREYNFYTPAILKTMPRITSEYDFDFANITGPASQVYAIRFYHTNDPSEINKYLQKNGFIQQKECHIQAVCWQRGNASETVTISTLDKPIALLVSVIYKF